MTRQNKSIDPSTEIIQEAVKLIAAVKERLGKEYFAGPMRAQLSNKEALQRLKDMTPDERLAVADQMGIDEFLREAEALENATRKRS